MDVTLAYPEGYGVMDEVTRVAKRNAAESGGSFRIADTMEDAFEGADVVYAKSWAPFEAMEKRTQLYGEGDTGGIAALEKELLKQNALHKDWTCSEEMMQHTNAGNALYLHCLPADITGVSCDAGEVEATVFDRYRDQLYMQASNKPYIIAAMIFLAKQRAPQDTLEMLASRGIVRKR